MSVSGDLKSLTQLFFDINSTSTVLGAINVIHGNWVRTSSPYGEYTEATTPPASTTEEDFWNQIIKIAGPGGCVVGWTVMMLFKNLFLQKKSNRWSGVAHLLTFGSNTVPCAIFAWLVCNIAYSTVFSTDDAKGEGAEEEDEVSFLKYFTNTATVPNYFVTGLISIILDMIFRRKQTSKIVSTLVLVPGILAGIISLAFWIDKGAIASFILGEEYNDNHAILIKWMACLLAGWYCYAGVVTQIPGCKKFTSFPCFLLVICIVATTSGMVF